VEIEASDAGEAVVAAMTAGGVELLFFTSGSELAFYQEAIAKARAQGRKAPRLVLLTHEVPALNAALGYAASTGKPAATAAHVDVGTQHYGSAIHSAMRSGLPSSSRRARRPSACRARAAARAMPAISGCRTSTTRTASCANT